MSLERIAIVRSADNVVVNICVRDTETEWTPPNGHFAQLDDGTAQIGGTFVGGVFIPKSAPPADIEEGPWFAVANQDLTMQSNVLADVTGFRINVKPSRRYVFDLHLWFRTAATATGILFTATGPANPVGFDMTVETAQTLASGVTGFNVQRITAYDGGAPTPSIDAASADRLCRVHGFLRTGPDEGPLQLRWRSEVNNSQVTLRQGSRASVRLV